MFIVGLEILIMCTISSFLVNAIMKSENIPIRVRRSFINQFVSIWIGILVAILCHNQISMRDFNTVEVIKYMEPNGTLSNRSSHMRNLYKEMKKIIFITTTESSVSQIALLTNTAQALYPVRKDKVLWVVVALPLESSGQDEEDAIVGNNSMFGDSVSIPENVTQQYYKNLRKILHRFGIPFVLLPSYGHLNKSLDTSWGGYKWPETPNRILQGYQTGLLWAIRNISSGVIMVGDLEHTHNSAIFSELQETKTASYWPTGFPPYFDSLGIPVYLAIPTGNENNSENETRRVIIGHDDGNDILMGSVPVEYGAFAVDLHYLRTHVPYQDHWKFSFDGFYTTSDLKIDLKDIQIMGNRGEEIFVWKTEVDRMPWPESIKVVKDNNIPAEKTNVKTLLETAFGPRYYLNPDIVVKVEETEDLQQYDLEEIQPYI